MKNIFMFICLYLFCFINVGYNAVEEYKPSKNANNFGEIGASYNNLSSLKYVQSNHFAKVICELLFSILLPLIFFVCHRFLKLWKVISTSRQNIDITTFIILAFFLNLVMNISSGYSFKWGRRAKSWT